MASDAELHAEVMKRLREVDPEAAQVLQAFTHEEALEVVDVTRAGVCGLWERGEVQLLLEVGTAHEVAQEARRRLVAARG